MIHRTRAWRWAIGLGICATAAILPNPAAYATPIMDGIRDAEYTLVYNNTTDPNHKLVNDPAAIPTPINDAADPRANLLLSNAMYAANTGSDLYIYIDMPNLDLNAVEAEWAIVMHLKGANDAIERLGVAHDPYGAACDYAQTPACNVVIKSNAAGFKHDYDGNQGYGFVLPANTALTDWDWNDASGFTGSLGWTYDTVNNLVHGVGGGGGEIVYKGAHGIELKVPLALFGTNPANSPVTPPKIGDQILMQFYTNMRDRTAPNYPRGPVDCIPFEARGQGDPATHDYSRGLISTYAPPYTLVAPATLEVSAASLRDALDLNHIVLSFTAPLGDGATTPANYTVTNLSTNTTIPVVSAVVEANGTKVDLELPVPYNTKLLVAAANVKNTSGTVVSAGKNTATFMVGTAVQCTMHDPYGIIAALGTNPDTGAAYRVTMTGSPIGWRNARPPGYTPTTDRPYGWNEIPMNPVSGQPNTYQSPVFLVNAGPMGFKLCLPEMPDSGLYVGWNALNPTDRRFFVPLSSSVVQVSANAAGPYNGTNYDGGPVNITFTLVDHDNLAAGRAVYVAGALNAWDGSITGAIPLPAVAGRPNTYSGTFTTGAGFGSDMATEYKYILIYDDPANPGTNKTDWDLLNPSGNRWIRIKGAGSPLAQSVTEFVGATKAVRILRIAAGLDMSPQFGNYYNELDLDMSGNITLLDAVKAIHS
ncbi:MAG TPA: hypothetical protein VGM51_10905 [Armatimonadota bacterium]|jgi:hypothetical protein